MHVSEALAGPMQALKSMSCRYQKKCKHALCPPICAACTRDFIKLPVNTLDMARSNRQNVIITGM